MSQWNFIFTFILLIYLQFSLFLFLPSHDDNNPLYSLTCSLSCSMYHYYIFNLYQQACTLVYLFIFCYALLSSAMFYSIVFYVSLHPNHIWRWGGCLFLLCSFFGLFDSSSPSCLVPCHTCLHVGHLH